MKYLPHQLINQVFPSFCSCGEEYHHGTSYRYCVPTESGNLIGINNETRIYELFQKGISEEQIDFIVNLYRIFPEQTCPFIFNTSFLVLEDKGTHEDIVFLVALVKVLFKEMLKVTSLSDSEYNQLKKTLKPIVIEIDDERIVKTMIEKEGGCLCGCKHVVNEEECDIAVIVNDVLIGIDMKKDILKTIFDICQRANIELWRYMYVFVEFYKLINKLFCYEGYKYCHCGKVSNQSIIQSNKVKQSSFNSYKETSDFYLILESVFSRIKEKSLKYQSFIVISTFQMVLMREKDKGREEQTESLWE